MLYPESAEFQEMPNVFATGFLVGLVEWACIQAVKPHIDWPNEQTVGVHVNLSHEAATPPDMEVTIRVKLLNVVYVFSSPSIFLKFATKCIPTGKIK